MFKTKLLPILSAADDKLAAARYSVRKKFKWLKPSAILPYRGYGNKQTVTIMGRVLEKKKLNKPSPYDTVWQNVQAMLRRYMSHEVPFATLKATFQGNSQKINADAEGYFRTTFSVDTLKLKNAAELWHPIEFELLNKKLEDQGSVNAVGEVMIPDVKSEFGVISDIDDTVLVSGTTQLHRMVKLALLENAATRLPFHGVAAFYKALQKGKEGQSHNPFFYVSSSPWNLYDVLADFFELNKIPKGPILLRDIGISETKFIKEKHSEHKPVKIRQILNTYPDMPFVLVGDNGQHDPEIYAQIIKEFPGRILAAYIRDVSPDRRGMEVRRISEEVKAEKVDMVLCADTEEASQHAVDHGFIQSSEMDDIHREKEKDEGIEK